MDLNGWYLDHAPLSLSPSLSFVFSDGENGFLVLHFADAGLECFFFNFFLFLHYNIFWMRTTEINESDYSIAYRQQQKQIHNSTSNKYIVHVKNLYIACIKINFAVPHFPTLGFPMLVPLSRTETPLTPHTFLLSASSQWVLESCRSLSLRSSVVVSTNSLRTLSLSLIISPLCMIELYYDWARTQNSLGPVQCYHFVQFSGLSREFFLHV